MSNSSDDQTEIKSAQAAGPDARFRLIGIQIGIFERQDGPRIQRYSYLVLCLVFLFTGCASWGTYNPATGRSELILISTPEEIILGNDIHKQLERQYKFSTDTKQVEKIERIGQKVARVSDRQDYGYQFFVVEQDELNAFTVPGGRIYVFSGLIDKLKTEDQIASVFAHEIGHCAARHTIKKFQASMGYSLISSIVLGQVGGSQAQELASMSSNMIMNIVFSAYGRQDEYEADRLGIRYLSLSGYSPSASIESLEILARESQISLCASLGTSWPFTVTKDTAGAGNSSFSSSTHAASHPSSSRTCRKA